MLIDLLKGLDNGGYYFFRQKAQTYQEIVPAMHAGNLLGSVWIALALVCLAALLLHSRGQATASLVTLLVFALAVGLTYALHAFIAGRRPEDAQDLLGEADMHTAFPPRSVLLFTLAAMMLLYALWPSLPGGLLRGFAVAVVIALVVWVSLSQLVLGLHFVTDVIAGLAGGVALGLLSTRFGTAQTDTP